MADSGRDDGEHFNIIHKIDSNEIIYSQPEIKYRLIGPYIKGDLLGEGSYGKVKECVHSRTLQRCAVKIMKHKVLRRIPNGEANVKREIALLTGFSHTNIIKLVDVMHSTAKQKIYMVMDYCVTGLQEMLDESSNKRFPIWQSHDYFLQTISGLEYLHSKGIIHKDIKPGNLLLTTNNTLKIIDFGVAEKLDTFSENDLIHTSQGSPVFQPPEVANGTERFPGFKLDVWSSGVTLFNMCTGDYPFDGENVFRLYENICDKKLDIPSQLDPCLSKLLSKMLEKDPYKRISIEDIKTHEWCLRNYKPNHEPGIGLAAKKSRIRRFTAIEAIRMQFYEDDDDFCSDQQFVTEHELNESRSRDELAASATGGAVNLSPAKNSRKKFFSCVNSKSFPNCIQS